MKVTSAVRMDDATRAALASGRAEPSFSLFVDTLMAFRGITVDEGEAISGASLEAEEPAELSPGALDMVFAAIDRGAPKASAKLLYPELAGVPVVLKDAILAAEARHPWDWAGPGIKRLKLDIGKDAVAEIIRIDASTKVPWHTHAGQELTLCLFGEFSDSRATYGSGDFSISDASIRHQPAAYDKGPVYALAVTDADLKFEGLVGVLQKIFRF